MKRYEGMHVDGKWHVHVATLDGKRVPLAPRCDLRNHSPSGLSWGYLGSGPAQLALALLCDALGDDARAMRLYQIFKSEIVAKLTYGEAWKMYDADIIVMVGRLERILPEQFRSGEQS